MTLLSVLIAKQRGEQLATLLMILDEHGVCSFDSALESTVGRKEQFQLLASSRYSFFGCWLHMSPLSNQYSSELLPNTKNKSDKQKRLFIYRDSLSTDDFSRLSQIIKKLKDFS